MMPTVQYEAEFIAHVLREWGPYVEEELRKKLSDKKIGITDAGRRSLVHRIIAAGTSHRGSYSQVFHEYLRFVDMGVGRKIKGLETASAKRDAIDQASGRRKAKKWYSKTFYRSLNNLISRLVNNYEQFAIEYVKEIEKNKT